MRQGAISIPDFQCPDVDAFCGNTLRAVLVEQERGVLTVVNHNIYLLAEGSETWSAPLG
jgi:hypothetical protein